MLRRRVIDHVKAQNWFAVGLDFLIVVIGVSIGLQVNNWNEARQTRIDERSLLLRLYSEPGELADLRRKEFKEVKDRHAVMSAPIQGTTLLNCKTTSNSPLRT